MATFVVRALGLVPGSDGLAETEPVRLGEGSAGGWSPDGTRIVYSHDGSLWTMDPDGSGRSLLVARAGSEFLGRPAWSPDGTRIAYARSRPNRDGHWFSHIYSVNVDGTAKTKLSSGDVYDSSPSWSPDSDRIVFERFSGAGRDDDGGFIDGESYVVVMDADGVNPVAITKGGDWEQSPVWSPDGRRIAYVSDLVWLVDPDGSNPTRAPTAGAAWNGGVSWSPYGRRLAFPRLEGDGSSIIIADIDGPYEVTVTNPNEWDTRPRWSPDGRKLLFTRHQPNGTEQLYVADARGRRTPTGCKPRGVEGGVGFPLHAYAAPATGRVKLTVLFMDFPNAKATHTPHTETRNGFGWMVDYLEAMSYQQLDLDIDVVHRWWRAPKDHETYLGPSSYEDPGNEAVHLASDSYDFSDTDMFVTVFPSEHFGGAVAGGRAQIDGRTLPGWFVNNVVGLYPGVPSLWSMDEAHEFIHELGLPDLYPFDDSLWELPDSPPGHKWVGSAFGLMGVTVHVASTDAALEFIEAVELLAWLRWQLGWLDLSQVQCGIPPDGSVTLQPVAQPRDGTVMAAIPLNLHQVIVIENRRKLGYDAAPPPTRRDGHISSHALLKEGVLVYTIDTLIGNGELPIKIAGDKGNSQVNQYPTLGVGESVTLHGHTITIIDDTSHTYTVTITKTD